jgi:ADP-ribosylglycohydrolase/Leucine-rich repeat (LRR) protein
MGQSASSKKNKNPCFNKDLLIPNPESLAQFDNFDLRRAKERVLSQLTTATNIHGELLLSRACLSEIPTTTSTTTSTPVTIQSIDLSYNTFTTVPLLYDLSNKTIQLFKLSLDSTKLTSINLSNNKLNTLDCSELFQCLKQLKNLNLSWNNLINLPDELFMIQSLEVLDISRNKLTSLSLDINKLKNLQVLNASLNNFHHFPDHLTLSKLQTLMVYRYPESNISIPQIPNFDNMTSLQKLHWRCHGTVDMSNLLLNSSNNSVNEIDLSFNAFVTLPSCSRYSTVTTLRLCSCKLSDLPNDFSLLVNLQSLYLRTNAFTRIPEVLFELTQLIELDFNVNGLTEIDQRIAQFIRLERLGLAYNKITHIPIEITQLDNLKILRLEYNEIENISSDVIQQGKRAIFEALLQHSSSTAEEAPEPIELSPDQLLKSRMRGCLYGQCIGDAMGLATEFLTFPQAIGLYGIEDIKCDIFWQDAHRGRWVANDHTDDSDQMLLTLDSILANNGKVDHKDFANRLFRWIYKGYEVLGDSGGLGLGQTVKAVVTHSYFLKQDPHDASKDIWQRSNKQLAANGAIMRTCVLGLLNFMDMEKIIDQTNQIAKVTHYDSRCIASCVAVTTFIAQVLQENATTVTPSLIDKYIDQSYEYALTELRKQFQQEQPDDPTTLLEQYEQELKQAMYTQHLYQLDLDESVSIGYTFKSLGSAFTSLRQSFNSTVELTLNQLTLEAGDADSNACVAGALLGCVYGYDSLPKQWIEGMPHKKWINAKFEEFINSCVHEQ